MPTVADSRRTEITSDTAAEVLKGISIPPCPTVVASLIQETRRPEIDFHRVVRLISGDVGLAASMLKTANSPFFGLSKKASTVQYAVQVLGLKNIVQIITGLALKHALSPKGGVSMDRFWDRSNYAAVIASSLAGRLPEVAPDEAYTFGLFHDCGIPILMQKFPDYKDTLALANRSGGGIAQVENERHQTNHVVVGSMLARNWFLPANVCTAIRYHHDFSIFSDPVEDAGPRVQTLVAIVFVAEHVVARFLEYPDDAEWTMNRDTVLDYLGYDPDEIDELQHDLRDDLLELQAYRG